MHYKKYILSANSQRKSIRSCSPDGATELLHFMTSRRRAIANCIAVAWHLNKKWPNNFIFAVSH